jgi:mono/diheme cytochrome c family protein
MRLCWRMSVALVCLAPAACEKPAEQPGRASEAEPDSARVASSRSDTLLLASAKIALPPEGVTPVDLPDPNSVGAGLLATYCAQCHALPTPTAHSATDWPGVVRRMWLRMGHLPEGYEVKVPDAGERIHHMNDFTEYALVVSGGALPPGRGRDDFAKVCSQCHALPDPAVHSAQDWVAVYQRMLRNMGRMKVVPPTAEESQGLLLYLQTVAGK